MAGPGRSGLTPAEDLPSPFVRVAGGVRAALWVTAKAGADRVDGVRIDADGRPRLRVAVTAPADRGAANAAVIALLARTWQLPASSISLVRGISDRRKMVELADDGAVLINRLNAWLAASFGRRVDPA